MFEPLAADKGLAFDVEIAPESPPEIHTDRSRLERILINLLGNAIKFTEHGRVSLVVRAPAQDTTFEREDLQAQDAVAFTVSDTGIGIAQSQLARVFSPFEQVEATSARRYEGSGLGLAIARESALLLGGELRAESEVGRGSAFTCFVSRGTQPHSAQANGSMRHFRAMPQSSTPGQRSSLILVIEDDALLAEQLTEIITDRGFEAIVVGTGMQGLEVAEKRRPRGIVLDVKLPDIDGWTVMERLQSSAATREIPVHFLSAVDAPESGLNRGAIGYLTKPASRQDLKDLIEALAPLKPNGACRVLVVEDNVREGQSIVAILEQERFEADHVTSAEAALTALERQSYGCIVLDLGLEEMDGLQLLEVLQEKPEFNGTGVVIHTGRSLTRKETNRLQAYSQAIVMKDGSSSTRLLEEIRLFIHHVRERFPRVETAEVEAAVQTTLSGVRLLLVEDDMRTVYSLSALLQSRGCEVLVAENGREALEVLASKPDVSCILMDIMMPEMDGYETMRHLRQDDSFRDLPIIVLTAKAMAGERERCLQAGASDYLSKPVESNVLFATLERWTSQSSEVSSAV
jgi:CheY-like chemotaxis protein